MAPRETNPDVSSVTSKSSSRLFIYKFSNSRYFSWAANDPKVGDTTHLLPSDELTAQRSYQYGLASVAFLIAHKLQRATLTPVSPALQRLQATKRPEMELYFAGHAAATEYPIDQ